MTFGRQCALHVSQAKAPLSFFFSCRVSPSFHHSLLSFLFVSFSMSQLLNRIRRRASHDYMAIPNEHSEQHFESAEVVRDIIIGLSGKIDLSLHGSFLLPLPLIQF